MKETEYAYAVAYTRTLENRMLIKADYEALLNAHALEEALRYLSDKGYGGNEKKDRSISEENLLKDELAFIWNEVRSACPKNAPIDVILYQNDFHNLKTILKAVFSGMDYKPLMLEPCTVSPDTIYRAIADGKPENLPAFFKQTASEAYHSLSRDGDGQHMETVLDKAFFSLMTEIAKRSESDFFIGWVDLNIALMDMHIALRGAYRSKDRAVLRDSMLECKRINADYLADAAARDVSAVLQALTQSGFEEAAKAAQESAGAFDKWCDNALIRYLQSVRHSVFGFEPIFAFLIGKQYEMQGVRIILSGIKIGIPPEVLRGRLRDSYV